MKLATYLATKLRRGVSKFQEATGNTFKVHNKEVTPLELIEDWSRAGIPTIGKDSKGRFATQVPQKYVKQIVDTSRRFGFQPADLANMFFQENRYRPSGTNPISSATGFAQITDVTAEEIRRKYNPTFNRLDPIQAIDGAGWYLSDIARRAGVDKKDFKEVYKVYKLGVNRYLRENPKQISANIIPIQMSKILSTEQQSALRRVEWNFKQAKEKNLGRPIYPRPGEETEAFGNWLKDPDFRKALYELEEKYDIRMYV